MIRSFCTGHFCITIRLHPNNTLLLSKYFDLFSADADTAQATFSSPPETFEDSFVEMKSVDNFDMAAFDDQWAETQQGFPSGKLLQYKVCYLI